MSLLFKQAFRKFASHGCKPTKTKCAKPSKKAKKRNPATCIVGPSGVHPAVEGGLKIYRNVFFFICIPILGLCGYNVATTYEEPERMPFVKLEYMRIRHKKFPWCGGSDRSFFHNPRINALPDGYEDIDEDE